MSVLHMYVVPVETRKPELEMELQTVLSLSVDDGNWIWVLWKNSQYSYLLSHLSSPSDISIWEPRHYSFLKLYFYCSSWHTKVSSFVCLCTAHICPWAHNITELWHDSQSPFLSIPSFLSPKNYCLWSDLWDTSLCRSGWLNFPNPSHVCLRNLGDAGYIDL